MTVVARKPRTLAEIVSTADAPIIMGAAVDTMVSVAYEENLSNYEQYVAVGDAPDFLPQHAISLTTNDRLDQLNERQEYRYGKFSERTAEWRIYRYGRLLGVTYEMLINDRWGAVRELAQNYGQIAGLTVSEFIPSFLSALPVSLDAEGQPLSGPLTDTLIDRALRAWTVQNNHDGQRVRIPLGRVVFNDTLYGRALRQIIRPSTAGDYNQFAGALPELGFIDEQYFIPGEDGFIYLSPDPARYKTLALDFLKSPRDAREDYTNGPRVIPEPGIPRVDWLPGDVGAGSEGFRFDELSFKIRHNFGGGWREEALPASLRGGQEGHRLGVLKIQVTA